jgi:hypothetical protein
MVEQRARFSITGKMTMTFIATVENHNSMDVAFGRTQKKI